MSAADDEIRNALLDHGDDGRTPRHTLFFFYDGDIEALEAAGRAEGFATRRMLEHSGLILEKTMAVDADRFEAVSAMMDAWAERFSSEFDGWECEVQANG